MAMQPKCGQSGYITPAVSGVSNTQHGTKKQKWLYGPNVDKVATITHAISGVPNARRGEKKQKWLCSPNVDKVATSPLPSRGSPTLYTGRKSKNGYMAQMWTKWLHHACRLGGPQCFARVEKA